MKSPKSNIDARIITLKTIHQPIAQGLYEALSDEIALHKSDFNFYCLQSHQLIGITEVHTVNEDDPLKTAYQIISKMRTVEAGSEVLQNADHFKAISVQQRLILFGEKTDFWEIDKPETLSISLLQLWDGNGSLGREEIRKKIIERIPEEIRKKCVLYDTLDFCDYVLVVKNFGIDALHDALWTITHSKKGLQNIVRDSFSMFCLEDTLIMDCLQKAEEGAEEEENGPRKICEEIELRISVESAGAFQSFRKELQAAFPSAEFKYTFGRNDILIKLVESSLSSVLKVIVLTDKYCRFKEEKDSYTLPAIREYEIELTSPYNDNDYDSNIEVDHMFHRQIFNAIHKLYVAYYLALNERQTITGYASVLQKELKSLNHNGFAEEFLLSVIPSFFSYLECAKICENHKSPTIKARLQKDYLEAMSTLVHCTMHGEKQFVQAPALNANIVDVSPKLMAFYAGVVYSITNALMDSSQIERQFVVPSYSFLIVPDFRKDIYVRHIPELTNELPPDALEKIMDDYQLLIMHLPEERYYTPKEAIAVMCHEIAHRVGSVSRKREFRVKSIFQASAFYWIYLTFPNVLTDESKNDLANTLGDLFFDEYTKHSSIHPDYQEFYYRLERIEEFLDNTNYLETFASDRLFSESLINSWVGKIEKTTIFSDLCCLYFSKQKTSYITELEKENRKRLFLPTLAGWVFNEFQKTIHRSLVVQTRETSQWFRTLIGTYREAYADFKMIELLDMDKNEYTRILEICATNIDCYPKAIRLNSVCMAAGFDPEVIDKQIANQDQFRQVCATISEYLQACKTENARKEVVQFGLFYKECSDNLLETVDNTIKVYREKLIELCSRIEGQPK